MAEVHVEGGLVNVVPCDYWGVIHCAACHWYHERRGSRQEDVLRRLERDLRWHQDNAHRDGHEREGT